MIEALRIIADLDPEFYFVENVRGILDGEGESLLREEIMDLGLGEPHFNRISAVKWGVPSHRKRVVISNMVLQTPEAKEMTVRNVIEDLPSPNFPHAYTLHYTSWLSEKYKFDMTTQAPGKGLVYFYGARKEYQNYIRLYFDQPAPVVMGKSRFIHPTQDRLLTPMEHARLMGFPDDYIFLGSTEEIYDMIGEAVPPLIAANIGEQVKSKL